MTVPWAHLFSAIGVCWYCLVCCIAALGFYRILTKFRDDPPASIVTSGQAAPGVSILKPLKGVDPELEAAITSAFQQDYPNFEIIFCVADPSDEVVPIVQKLCEKFPNVPSRLLIGARVVGPNPKICNLVQGFDQAKHDILWVLDSNVWVPPNTLGHSVETLQRRGVSLVHHLPLCIDISSALGSRLDEMFMGTAHAKFYTAINTVLIAPCVMGKSNLYRKSDILQHSSAGIAAFAQFIAEDHLIADSLWKLGGRTAMTGDVVRQPISGVSASDFFSRRVRWLRVRKYMVTAATLVEPTTECFVIGLMGTLSFKSLYGLGFSSLLFLATHILVWMFCDYYMFSYLVGMPEKKSLSAFHQANHRDFDSLRDRSALPIMTNQGSFELPDFARTSAISTFSEFVKIWWLRELAALPIWIVAMLGTRISWRGRNFCIRSNMTVYEIA